MYACRSGRFGCCWFIVFFFALEGLRGIEWFVHEMHDPSCCPSGSRTLSLCVCLFFIKSKQRDRFLHTRTRTPPLSTRSVSVSGLPHQLNPIKLPERYASNSGGRRTHSPSSTLRRRRKAQATKSRRSSGSD